MYSSLFPAPSSEGPPPKIKPIGFLASISSIDNVFEIIYYEYEKLVYYICYTITKDKHASEDLTQETKGEILSVLNFWRLYFNMI